MKYLKLCFLCALLMPAMAMAAQDSTCRIEACGGGGDDCLGARLLDVDPDTIDEARSYVCQKGHCENGTIVHNASLDRFFMCRIASESGVNFLWMGNDTWYEYPVQMCVELSDNAINSENDPNATLALKNDTAPNVTFRRNSTATSVIQAGADICLEYVCNEGYKPNPQKTACVEETEQQQEDNQQQNNQQQDQQQNNQQQDQQQNNQQNNQQQQPARKCSDRCARMSENRKAECIACCGVAETVAKWDYDNNRCFCVTDGKEDTTKKFDVASKQCVAKDSGGDNGSGEPGKPDNDTPVVNPPVVVPDPSIALRAKLTAQINTAITNLNTIKSGFDVSRWKSADGTFNTSRLVSDSVAGVVLGTAGGLITSNVIKKNQVKNGFEDISCTVGGQVVAGWDDQFSVGIR